MYFQFNVIRFKLSARATLSMTTLLTLTGMLGNLSASTPQISYTTKMDTWMVASMVFVFSTLLELVGALVCKMYLTDNLNNKVWATTTSTTKPLDDGKKPETRNMYSAEEIDKKLSCAEKCLTVFYFAAFVIFCLAYWLTI